MAELTPAESRRLFTELIEPALFGPVKARSLPKPRAVFLGGQPGSGKSTRLRRPVESELQAEGAVVIDADQMRLFHPEYEELSREDDRTAAVLTHPDAARWVDQGVEAAIREGCHVIFDGTMGSPGSALRRIQRFLDAGYEVEVRVLAVDGQTSWLGVLRRYEEAKAANGYGRMTPREVHDEAYDGLEQTVEEIRTQKPAIRVRVYDRDQRLLHDSATASASDATDALRTERTRALTQAEITTHDDSVDRIVHLASKRDADQATLDEYRALRR